MEIFKLFGSIFIKSEDAESSIQSVNNKASNIVGTLGKGITTAAKWGAAFVTAAGVAVTAMVGFASNAADAADEVDKMSQKIGLSIEGYQEWAYVMGQNGMEIDKLQTGMKTLVQQMDSAASGTASAIENFDRLGVSIYDVDGGLKNQETIMNEVLRALADMENGTEKARLATELFGKSGTEMMPMLNQGSAAIDELTDRAHELGLIMSEETVKAGVTLGDLMDDVKQSFSQIAVSLGSALFPAIQMITELILDNVPMINTMVQQMVPVMESSLMAVVPLILQMAQGILPVLLTSISNLFAVLLPLTEQLLPIISDVLMMLLPPIANIINALLPLISAILTPLLELLTPILGLITPILDIVLALLDPIIQIVQSLLPVLISWLEPLIQLVLSILQPILDLVKTALEPLLGVLVTLIESALSIIQPILEAFVGLIGAVLTPLIQALMPLLEAVLVALSPLLEAVALLLMELLTPLIPIIEAVATMLGGVLGNAINALMPLINGIIAIFSGLITYFVGIFTGDWEKVWSGIVEIFKGIVNLIPTIFESVINVVIGLINGIIDGINDLSATIGIKAIPTIPEVDFPPLLEEGGVLEKGQVGFLEGNGAEAVVPLENNKKWIASLARDMEGAGIGSNAETTTLLKEILQELKKMNADMYENMVEALCNGVSFNLDRREFARLVKAVN